MLTKKLQLKFNAEDKELNSIYKSIRADRSIMKLTKSFIDKFNEVVKKDISINDSYKMIVDNDIYNIRVTGWLRRIEIYSNKHNEKLIVENIDKKDSSKLFKPVFVLLYKTQYK